MASENRKEPLEGELLENRQSRKSENKNPLHSKMQRRSTSVISSLTIASVITCLIPYIGLFVSSITVLVSNAYRKHEPLAILALVVSFFITGIWSIIIYVLSFLF